MASRLDSSIPFESSQTAITELDYYMATTSFTRAAYVEGTSKFTPSVHRFISDLFDKYDIVEGLEQKQHTALIVSALREFVFTEMTDAEFKEVFALIYPLMNGSALRQKCEKSGLLKESLVKKGADAQAMADKFI